MSELVQTTRGRVLTDVELEDVRSKIVDVVLSTFNSRPMPSGNITEKELQDRLDVAVEIWNHLYGECRWSREMAIDHIPMFLIMCIDGARVSDAVPEPAPKEELREGSTMWAPEKLNDTEPERRLSALAATDDKPVLIDVNQCGNNDYSGGHDDKCD